MNIPAAAARLLLVAWSLLPSWPEVEGRASPVGFVFVPRHHNRRCDTLHLPLPVVCHPHHKHHLPVVMAARRGGDGNDGRAAKLKMRDAKLVEKLLLDAVRKLSREEGDLPPSKLFPSVRQCNSALATFGDVGEFRRALRLFVQMKKSATLAGTLDVSSSSVHAFDSTLSEGGSSRISSIELVLAPPKPTLVTYSTLMSRAVSLGKPKVALRLWNLMRNQPNFYTNVVSRRRRDKRIATKQVDTTELRRLELEDDTVIIPDVVFCNTLMNIYAKLGDHVSARSILNAMLGANVGSCHEGIPLTGPTAVTYNTLADACKAAGELGSALETLELMIHHADETGDRNCLPDVQTYTTLISTVARKKKNDKEARDVRSGGENDPDMAFALLNRMLNEGITPNGVTYSALIDVCGRCRRTDMALNGLRTMLKQKSKASLASRRSNVPIYHQQSLYNEVGAWTAAINACGKGGRVDTAIRLFRTMQSVGVKPNAVTCGCLADCLLKASPVRMAETLEVLGYMQKAGIAPGEVMYTSLMSVALSLAQKETEGMVRRDGLELQIIDRFDRRIDTEDASSESIVLYSELMRLMVADGNDTNSLLKVFLAFQAMRNAGASPDVACYNSLLRACALSGDVSKAQEVLQRMNDDEVEPNRRSWREALKAARKAKKSGVADVIWTKAIAPPHRDFTPLIPQASDVELLLSVYTSELRSTSNHKVRSLMNSKIMRLYEGIVDQSEGLGFHHGSVSLDEIESNQAFMLSVLRAAVSHEFHCHNDEERQHAKELACEIAGLEAFQLRLSSDVDRNSKKALQVAQDWLYSY